jgi:hypothetical protein
MKHKLTVLACIGLALLLTSGVAFAQNTVTVVGGPLLRCANNAVLVQLTNAVPVGAIGLPLRITGGATITGAAAGPALGGFTTAVGGFPGAAGVLNAFGGTVAPGANQNIWTLTVATPSACQANITIDTAFFPPAGAFMLLDACCPVPASFAAGVFTLVNQAPICGANTDETVNFAGAVAGKQLHASDPDACDALTYGLVSIAPPVTGAASVSAAGIFAYSATCADKGTHVVTFSATDGCGGTVNCTFNLTVTNTAPACAANSAENVYFGAGVVNKQLHATDADGNPLTYSLVSVVPPAVGAASVTAAGVFNYATVCGDVGTHTVTFHATDGCDGVDCTFQVTVFQNPPVATCPSDASVDWDAVNQVYTLNATDDGCIGPLTWSLLSALPAPANVPTVAGNHLTFDPACADVAKGPIALTVVVSDGQKSDTCGFNVTVTDAAPTITCPGNQFGILGDLVHAQVNASDPAGNSLTYSLVSFTGLDGQGAPHNAPSLGALGAFSWQTSSADNHDAGTWEACVKVEDACGASAQCCFQIEVLSYALCVRSDLDSVNAHVLNGQDVTVYVTLSNTYPLGGIDLLLCYDPSGLAFFDAFPVDELSRWEYFTWRHSAAGNCTNGACPSGYIRIVAIADLDNGPTKHPADPDFYLSGKVVGLKFHVSQDRNYIDQCFDVNFCVLDCGDNTLSSKSGDTLFIPIGAPTNCIDPHKQVARPIVQFCPGRICIMRPPDDRGDENLNGVANEVGDVVLFTNYFVYGPSVWDAVWKDVQILSTDINNDGTVLTVADLIYQIRIITGDAQPFPPNAGGPKLAPYANSGTATLRVENGSATISTSSSVDLGGAMFTFRYSGVSVGQPTLTGVAAGMVVSSHATAGELRVLVTPSLQVHGASIAAGSHELFSIPTTGDGTLELVDVSMSDAQGALMSTASAKSAVPTEYALLQNYPNPFNAGTVMSFNLKDEAAWSLVVYNIAGQTVREFSGHNGSGTVSVAWDGRDNAGNSASSGVYFYRVTANGFNATKKMTLVK